MLNIRQKDPTLPLVVNFQGTHTWKSTTYSSRHGSGAGGANFFFIGNKTFIDKNEHHVHDDEHSEHEIKTHGSRTKTNRL